MRFAGGIDYQMPIRDVLNDSGEHAFTDHEFSPLVMSFDTNAEWYRAENPPANLSALSNGKHRITT